MSSVPPVTPPAVRRRSRLARIADRIVLGILAFIAISQLLIFPFWEPAALGISLKNLVTYGQVILGVGSVLLWWIFFAPAPMALRLVFGGFAIAAIVGWISSIRSHEFDGHMRLTFHYRWQESDDERLARYRESQGDAAPVVIESVPTVTAEDVPAFRGAQRDGVFHQPPLTSDWEASPPTELWRHPCGGGYASFAVVGDYAFTLEQREASEAVVCYEAATGKELWEHRYPANFVEALGGPGPRSTPTIEGDNVLTLGAFGDLFCLDFRSGQPRWHVNVLQQFQIPNAIWAMTASPLVIGEQVLVNVGGREGNGLAAYGLKDGELAWKTAGLGDPQLRETYETGKAAVADITGLSVPGYSSPMLATLRGEEIILNLDGTAFRGHRIADGAQLWEYPMKAGDNINVCQPLVIDDNRLFLSASYGFGAVMLQVQRDGDNWSVSKLWDNKLMRCKFTSPVRVGDHLYGLDEGILVCLNIEDGKRPWKGGKGLRPRKRGGDYGHGQILLVNDQIIALTESGEAVLVDPQPDQLRELAWMRVLPDDRVWNTPAIQQGRLFVRSHKEMACYDLRKSSGSSIEVTSTK